MELRWRGFVLDVIIVFLLMAAGGVIVGVAGVTGSRAIAAISASNLLLGTVGFIIVGCRHDSHRILHACSAALGNWILGLALVVTGSLTVSNWILSVVPLLLIATLGGFVARLFTRRNVPQPPPALAVEIGQSGETGQHL